MNAPSLIARLRSAHPWLSDEWEQAVKRELQAGKKRSEKAMATLLRIHAQLKPWQQTAFREVG